MEKVEFIGYAARITSARQKPGCWKLMPYIIQSMYILLAPALFAASIYMILGRIILLTDGEAKAIIKQRWLTKTFVCGDILCFLLQSGGKNASSIEFPSWILIIIFIGGGLIAGGRNNPSMAHIGNGVIIAGLVLQLLWFMFFLVVAGIFHHRMKAAPTAAAQGQEVHWMRYLNTLYVVSALIVVRSLFRIIEYIQGNSGYLLSHEAFLYVFDAIPMLIVVVWLHWRNPGEIGLLLRGKHGFRNGFELVR